MLDPIIIQDTREKKPWDLEFYGFNVIRKKVETGDIAIQGREDFLFVDRKASISELAQNLFYDYKRFKAEMIRASVIKHAFLVCEFGFEHVLIFPKSSNIPRRKWEGLRATTLGIMNKLDIIYQAYGVKTIFCENREAAEQKTVELLNIAINGGSFDNIEYYIKAKEPDEPLN